VKTFIKIGVDLAKNVFQLHGIEREDGSPFQRKLTRVKSRELFSRLTPCRVGMEACGSAHYWARVLAATGHEVVLTAPAYVKRYVKRGKDDAADAAAAEQAVALLARQSEQLDSKIDALEKTIAAASAKRLMSGLLQEIPAIGPLFSSAIVASAPDPGVFKSGRDFAASLGVTRSQRSSGGKERLGAITKRGNRYLRKMLVVGGASVLRVAHKYKGSLAEWIVAMKANKPECVAAVAVANKLARICWAMLSTGESFREELYARA
jgi:transposase